MFTEDQINAKAYDLLEDGATYAPADFAAVRERAVEALLAEDEGNLSNDKLAIECAMLRDFLNSDPAYLAEDYAKHGNAWPFSGDHLGTYFVREDVYTPGVGHEPGDVIGRERRPYSAAPSVWSKVSA